MVKLKVGRNIIELDEKDLILDNGACYQIVTKKVGGFDWYYPIMSKKLFHDLKKLENCASHSRYFSDELDAQNFYQNGNKCLSYSYAYGILFL